MFLRHERKNEKFDFILDGNPSGKRVTVKLCSSLYLPYVRAGACAEKLGGCASSVRVSSCALSTVGREGPGGAAVVGTVPPGAASLENERHA